MCNLSNAALHAPEADSESASVPLTAADIAEFGRRFDLVQAGLPRLFAGYWRSWTCDADRGWARVHGDGGRCVLEMRRLSTREWIAWLCVAELRAISARGPTVTAVLRALGLLDRR